MPEAAHPQPADAAAAGVPDPDPGPPGGGPMVNNPFPSTMTVPGVGGQEVVVDLAVDAGVVYAPHLDQLPIDAYVRQYITQYCAAWSSSVVTTGKLEPWPPPPRRAQIVFQESQLHAMLGLAPDERLVRIAVDDLTGTLRLVVDSPRLSKQPYWEGGPPTITLPVSAWYEGREAPR